MVSFLPTSSWSRRLPPIQRCLNIDTHHEDSHSVEDESSKDGFAHSMRTLRSNPTVHMRSHCFSWSSSLVSHGHTYRPLLICTHLHCLSCTFSVKFAEYGLIIFDGAILKHVFIALGYGNTILRMLKKMRRKASLWKLLLVKECAGPGCHVQSSTHLLFRRKVLSV